MKAKDISGQAPGGKREKLAEVLPLNTPYVVQIFPVYACNFKCVYCLFSVEKEKRGFISDETIVGFDLFKKCVDDMTQFPQKIKVLRFVGIGEPLLHKKIVDMVAYAASKEVAHKIEILTNGFLLTHQMSDALINAGLSRLVVSVQGTTQEKYQETSGVDIDFDEFINNLKYFYDHKAQAEMYVKIVDTALDGKDDEQRFCEIYGDVCDTMAIEHTVPLHDGIDFEKVLKGKDLSKTQFGLPVGDVKVCPQPFYTLQINPDGKIVPCYSWEYPGIMGDCHNQSVVDIWNGKVFQQLRRAMLNGLNCASKVCANCKIIKYRLFPEDDLNNDAERLKQFYDE